MNLIHLDNIIIPDNRLRRDFDPLYILGLQQSITEKSLLQAIVLRNDGRTLVAGEQRLKAMTELHRQNKPFYHDGQPVPRDAIPYVALKDLPPLQLMEAEYEENAIRRDLNWQEKQAALAGLHKLRSLQKESMGKVQSLVATASEVAGHAVTGSPVTAVSDSLLVEGFKDDPRVMGAKSLKEAVNIARRLTTEAFMKKAAEQFKEGIGVTSPHDAVLGSFLDEDLNIAGNYDVIITDPPYGINADKMAPMSGSHAGTEHEYEDSPEYAGEVMQAILSKGALLCKPDAALYMFCDFRHFTSLVLAAPLWGWTPWPTPIIGVKPSGGMLGDSSHGPRKAYECVFYAYKGQKKTTGVYFDWFTMDSGDSKLHAANKPVSAYVNLLKRSTSPGMSVLDPCMGSGTIFVAANQLSLKATGIEVSKAHFGTAITRINDKE